MQDERLIAVTGAGGFIGRNLVLRLKERGFSNIVAIGRMTPAPERLAALHQADVIIHLAGVNRPQDTEDFVPGNVGPATELRDAVAASAKAPLVIYASSTKAVEDTPYGRSKRAAEDTLLRMAGRTKVLAYRLPNVFGKWCRPNYNSAVATFCHNLAHGLEITVNERAPLSLVYIDDVIDEWLAVLDQNGPQSGVVSPKLVYETTVGEVARLLRGFAKSRTTLELDGVGKGLPRALYATYVSYLPSEAMSYPLRSHTDLRGTFAEMLRTGTTGQFSFFTAHPGVTRGGHYHHTKTEKFLVLSGKARFRFRHILTGETRVIDADGAAPVVVETLPGWAHDVTNTGSDTLICMLWANENFDPAKPDTIAAQVA